MDDGARSRREYLLGVGAAGTTGLAGCSGDTDESPTESSESGSPSANETGDGETDGENAGTEGDDGTEDEGGTDDGSATVGAADSVRTFRYDPANTGHDATGTGPASDAEVEWSATLGDGVRSSPAVVDGTVYVGCWDGSVYALETASGDEAWTFETGDAISNSPAVVDGTVYVGSHDGNCYALTADGGDEDWQFETDGPVLSSPTVSDETVFVGSHDGRIYALDGADGDEIWRYDHDEAGAETVSAGTQQAAGETSTPAVVDGTVYVTRDSTLLALDADEGTRAWAIPLEDDPSSLDRRSLDGATGWTLRNRSVGGAGRSRSLQMSLSIPSSPAVVDGAVFVGQSPDLSAVDATGPERRWSPQAGSKADDGPRLLDVEPDRSASANARPQVHFGVESSPAVADELVYAGGDGVRAFGIDSGDREWEQPLEAAVESSPAVVGGVVYVGASDGTVRAFDAADGTERWTVDLGDPVRSSPAVVDGTLYVGTDGGTIHALVEP